MTWREGLYGMVGGIVLYGFVAVLWGSARFVAPSIAAGLMWVAVLALIVALGAPLYYWFGLPAYHFYRRRTA